MKFAYENNLMYGDQLEKSWPVDKILLVCTYSYEQFIYGDIGLVSYH